VVATCTVSGAIKDVGSCVLVAGGHAPATLHTEENASITRNTPPIVERRILPGLPTTCEVGLNESTVLAQLKHNPACQCKRAATLFVEIHTCTKHLNDTLRAERGGPASLDHRHAMLEVVYMA